MKEVDPCAGAVCDGNRHGLDVTRLVLAAIDGSRRCPARAGAASRCARHDEAGLAELRTLHLWCLCAGQHDH